MKTSDLAQKVCNFLLSPPSCCVMICCNIPIKWVPIRSLTMFCIPSKFRFDALYDSSKMKVKSHIMFQEPKDSFAVLFNLSCRLTSSPSLPSERPFIFLWRCCNPSPNLACCIVSQCYLNEWCYIYMFKKMPLWNYFNEYKGGNSNDAIAHVVMAESCNKLLIFRLYGYLIWIMLI